MLCIHRTIIIIDRIGIPGSKRYLIVSKTGNSVYCAHFQEEHAPICWYVRSIWPNIFCVFATKLCAPTTYQRFDINILPTFTMLRPFVGLVRICSREWFLTYYTKTTNKEFTMLSPFVGLVRICSREWF